VAAGAQQLEAVWQHEDLDRSQHLVCLQQQLRLANASLPETAKNSTASMTAANFLMMRPRIGKRGSVFRAGIV
jgi:hypothetical protein